MDQLSTAVVVAIVIFGGTLVSLEVGFRFGRHDVERSTVAYEGITAFETAVFGLLGLLLGFSFAGAMSRLEAKRELIVAEADAIGTAYLRVDVLPPDAQPPIRQQFKRLIEARIGAFGEGHDSGITDRNVDVFHDAQREIWLRAVAATASSSDVAPLVLPAINGMIDVSTARSVGLQAELPTLILALLVGAALSSGLFGGYGMAKRHNRSWFHGLTYAALLALTVYTVLDLDHPRFGLINIGAAYKPLTELHETIK